MSVCIYCIDNDIIKKLATFGIFDRTIQLFDARNEQIKILETAKYKFGKDWENFKSGKSRRSEDKFINYEKTVQICKALSSISESHLINRDLYTELVECNDKGIDPGEALLTSYAIAILKQDESAQLFTGDKRFLRALAKIEMPVIKESLIHRIWCLEQLVLKNITADGFESVREKIVSVKDCDKAIKSVFGSGMKSTEASSCETLNKYIYDLRNDVGDLLHPYPEQ